MRYEIDAARLFIGKERLIFPMNADNQSRNRGELRSTARIMAHDPARSRVSTDDLANEKYVTILFTCWSRFCPLDCPRRLRFASIRFDSIVESKTTGTHSRRRTRRRYFLTARRTSERDSRRKSPYVIIVNAEREREMQTECVYRENAAVLFRAYRRLAFSILKLTESANA